MRLTLSVTLAESTLAKPIATAADQGADACDPWEGSRSVLAWERDSRDADVLAFFQTAAWARAAGVYDMAIGRRPVLLSWRKADHGGFSIPLSIGRERGCMVARVLGEQLSEYANVVGEDATPARLRQAFALLRRRYRVDVVVLRRVPVASPFDSILDQLGAMVESPQEAPWVPLGPDGPASKATGGRVTGYRLACRHRRRLQQQDGYRFEALQAGDVAPDLLRLALSWKKDWIKERMLVSRVGTEALDSATCALLTTPGVGATVGVLWSGGEPVAIETGFLYRDRFFGSLRAYRLDRGEQRVGKIVLAEMVEYCARRGATVFDHGPPADAYKLEWTDRTLSVHNRIVPLSLLGRIHGQVLEGTFKPVARTVFGWLPTPIRKGLLRLTRYTH